jgi:hypothetical protein
MEKQFKDLLVLEEYAYFYGLLLADGNIQRRGVYNKAQIRVELSARDEHILVELRDLLAVYRAKIRRRTKDTNFKKEVSTVSLSISNTNLANELEVCGISSGKKAEYCDKPTVEFNERGFFRGFFDGDGSLGLTRDGTPFISIVTKSEAMKNTILEFTYSLTRSRKNVKRNTRDNIYNLTWRNEDALAIADYLYGGNPTYKLNRKYESYLRMKKWIRTKPIHPTIDWTPEMDALILEIGYTKASKVLSISQGGAWRRYEKLIKQNL